MTVVMPAVRRWRASPWVVAAGISLHGRRAGILRAVSAIRKFWDEIQEIFDPELPVEEPALFAERDREYNPLARLEKLLKRPTQLNCKYLVAGTVGNGKTSELNHLGVVLSKHRTIIQLDLWRHFQASVGDPAALSRLDPWELLGLLGLAIYRAGAERLGHTWKGEQDTLQKVLEELRKVDQGDGPSIDIPRLAKGMVVAASSAAGAVVGGLPGALAGSKVAGTALTMLGATVDSTSWSWKIGTVKKHREDQEVRGVLNAVNAMIMALQAEYGHRLLLLVDGLDRADAARIRTLFVDSALLGELVCDAVWIAPGAVQLLENNIRGFELQELCNVPVLLRADPSKPGRGLEFFRSLVTKRLAQVRKQVTGAPPEPFPDPLVDRLAYYSGGVSRDFVRMVRMAAGEAWEAEAVALTPEIVEFTLREARRLKEAQMNSEEIQLLERLMLDPSHMRPPGPVAAALAAQQRMLAYPNETTWYYPHPLLTLKLLNPGRGSLD